MARIFDLFDKAYVLHAARRRDRLRRVTRHLGSFGIELERFPAIVAKSADGFDTPEARGWAWSHLEIWKKALAAGVENVLVFEDDVALRDDVARRMEPVVEQLRATTWDVLYLGVSLFRHSRESRGVAPNLREFDLGGHLLAYGMNRRSLARAVDMAGAMLDGHRKAHMDHVLAFGTPPLRKLHTWPLLAVPVPEHRTENRLWEYFTKFPQADFIAHSSELRAALAAVGYGRKIPPFQAPPGAEAVARPRARRRSR